MADIAASVLAKLKNKAKASGISYQQCLQLFFQEEFLRKLAGSKYADNFVLKGGLFIYTLTNFESRATVDIDFLMRGLNNDLARMDEIIAEILAVPTGNDFVSFKATKTEPIAVQRKYHGISTQITGYIKNVRVPFNVDIGVGDVIIPSPERRNIQTQLEGYEKPEILTYSLESTIAEKFDAILQRLELTGRMKDFYDIYYLSRTFDFDGLKLQTAIQETLQNRGTAYEKDSFDRILALANDEGMQAKWRFFLKTLGNSDLSFSKVVDTIAVFLKPVWTAILSESELQFKWSALTMKWEQTLEEELRRHNELERKLAGPTAALKALTQSNAWVKMADIDSKLLKSATSALEQMNKTRSMLSVPDLTPALSQLQQLDKSILGNYQMAVQAFSSSGIIDRLSEMDKYVKFSTDGFIASLEQLSKSLKMYQSPTMLDQIGRVLEQWTVIDASVFSIAKDFDWSTVEFKEDDVISYDGTDYSPSDLAAELDSQISGVQNAKPSLQERVDQWKKNWWLLLMIINLIWTLPEVPEKIEFYRDAVSHIQEMYADRPEVCYTIKENSVLRKEPSSNADRLCSLLYDTPLEILDDVPRWYQVKYTDPNGFETIGWISKISVEMED